MSLSDEVKKYDRNDYRGLAGYGGAIFNSINLNDFKNKADSYLSMLDGVLSSPIGEVTSRDQIINPFDYLDTSMYANTRRGQARLNSDLERLKIYAQQQEAVYKEWFESPEQVYARERLAGRNPDLTDVMNQEAGQVDMPSESPIANIPTNGEVFVNSLSAIANVFSSVSGVINTFSSIGLVQAQKDGQLLSNANSFTSSASDAISDALALALSNENFSMEEFFSGNFDEIYKSIAPVDNARYRGLFNRVLNQSKKIHSDAYNSLSTHEDRRKAYLSKLASSYYSADDNEMVGQLGIVVQADEELHRITVDAQSSIQDIVDKWVEGIDFQSALDAFNSQNEYQADYFNGMNGEIMAVLQQAQLSFDSTIKKASSDVYKYLNDKFASATDSATKQRIGFEIMAGANLGWQDHLYASGDTRFNTIINQIETQIKTSVFNAAAALFNSSANLMNADTNEGNLISNFVDTAVSGLTSLVGSFFGKKR